MTSPILREFKYEDAVAIINRDGTQGTPHIIAMQSDLGPCFTAEADGVPIGCGGIIQLWPGVGVCWMVLSEDIGKHGIWLTKTTKEFIRRSIEIMQLHRLEATALTDSTRNQSWLELLGFTRERDGIAQLYLPTKQSMVRYEMVGM